LKNALLQIVFLAILSTGWA